MKVLARLQTLSAVSDLPPQLLKLLDTFDPRDSLGSAKRRGFLKMWLNSIHNRLHIDLNNINASEVEVGKKLKSGDLDTPNSIVFIHIENVEQECQDILKVFGNYAGIQFNDDSAYGINFSRRYAPTDMNEDDDPESWRKNAYMGYRTNMYPKYVSNGKEYKSGWLDKFLKDPKSVVTVWKITLSAEDNVFDIEQQRKKAKEGAVALMRDMNDAWGRDKSGYIVNHSKYKEMLAKIRRESGRYASRVEQFMQRINAIIKASNEQKKSVYFLDEAMKNLASFAANATYKDMDWDWVAKDQAERDASIERRLSSMEKDLGLK